MDYASTGAQKVPAVVAYSRVSVPPSIDSLAMMTKIERGNNVLL